MPNDNLDVERVAQIRRMLSQPGGEAEVRRRFGESAVNGPEYNQAKREMSRSKQRHAKAREDLVAEAEDRSRDRRRDEKRREADRQDRSEQRSDSKQPEKDSAAARRSDGDRTELAQGQRQGHAASVQPTAQATAPSQTARQSARQQQAQERVQTMRTQLAAADRQRQEKELADSQSRGQGR
ncbi:hypothetical protein GCM10010528_23200 [Gordonia defluvii]|uniref:Uncharacterized protein n=1 Tax=Gordonia defluvii TaxID=283718 RepID=A0ABP6LGR4_9ACTN